MRTQHGLGSQCENIASQIVSLKQESRLINSGTSLCTGEIRILKISIDLGRAPELLGSYCDLGVEREP